MGASRYLEDEDIWIAAGEVKNVSHVNKFGFKESVGSADFETVWDGTGNLPYLTTASTLTVTADDIADSGDDIIIQGLDGNYQPLSETIEATTAGNTGTSEFLRVFRAQYIAEVDSDNTADINITGGGGQTLATISAGFGQSLMAVYTVPANTNAYLKKIQTTTDKNQAFETKLIARPIEQGSFNTKGRFSGTEQTGYDYTIPLKFEAKTDLEVRAKGAGSPNISAVFDLILVEK